MEGETQAVPAFMVVAKYIGGSQQVHRVLDPVYAGKQNRNQGNRTKRKHWIRRWARLTELIFTVKIFFFPIAMSINTLYRKVWKHRKLYEKYSYPILLLKLNYSVEFIMQSFCFYFPCVVFKLLLQPWLGCLHNLQSHFLEYRHFPWCNRLSQFTLNVAVLNRSPQSWPGRFSLIRDP